jgi:GNAT superfamily N-acetyltransferase
MLIDHDFLYIAEKEGEMIGFGAGIPDINEIAINFKKGRLLPFNIFKLLFNKKKTRKIRIILLGVLEEYRQKGVAAVLFARFIETAQKRKIDGGEASWVLESNEMMNKAAVNLNGKKYKTYRIYSKKLTSSS